MNWKLRRVEGGDDEPNETSEQASLAKVHHLPAPASGQGDAGAASKPLTVEKSAQVSALRRTLTPHADRRLLPTRGEAWLSIKWWARAIWRIVAYLALHPWKLFADIRPIAAGAVYVGAAWTRWASAEVQAAHVKEAIGDQRGKLGETNERRRESRKRTSLIVVLIVALVVGYLLLTHRWQWVAGAAVLGIAVLDAIGRHVRKPKLGPVRTIPRPEVGPGSPVAAIEHEVEEELIARGHVPHVAEGQIIEHGVKLTVVSAMEVTDEDVAGIERRLHGFPGSVVRIQDRRDAARGELRWMWTDPLDTLVVPPRYLPLSQDVATPGDLGLGWNAQRLLLPFLRTNMIIVGGPGSGKSSAGWAMVDYLTAARNARVSVIDITNGPFGEAWGDVLYRYATTEAEAIDLLKEAIDRAKRRTKAIAGRSRPTADGRPVVGSENWNPNVDGGPQHTIFVDEVPTAVTNTTLRELWSEHMRIGRKAAENSIGMTQASDGDTIKLTAFRKFPSVKIMLACSREDVIGLMGGGMLKAGWRPDRLIPAEGDEPNDAGKGYVHGGQYNSPTPWRFPRLELEDIWARAVERLAAGLPLFEGQNAPGTVDEDPAVEVPELLAAVEAVFRMVGTPEVIASEELLAALTAKGYKIANTTALAKRLGEWIAPRGRIDSPDGKRPRGYRWDDVRDAIEGLG